MTELARRICIAHHPHLRTTGAQVPCGTHLQEARNVWGLATDGGTTTLAVIMAIRTEAMLPTTFPLAEDPYEPTFLTEPVEVNEITMGGVS